MQKRYFYVAHEYADLPKGSGKHTGVHVAFRAPLGTVNGPEGRIMSAPDVHGISGYGVWKINIDVERRLFSKPTLARRQAPMTFAFKLSQSRAYRIEMLKRVPGIQAAVTWTVAKPLVVSLGIRKRT